MLRQLLGDETAQPQEERYTFTWPGKSQARNEAELTPELTLRPCPEDSLNFNATGNIYIEGDNLDALRVIRKSLRQKVKMIYIDPPYNTGNDFIYRDNFTASREDYSRSEGSTDSEGFRVIKNTVANGRIHSDWCSMIYARLLVARDLLRHDGVIFISIDDNEQANLRKICDEVFGERNFVAQLSWKGRGGRQDSKYFAVIHEYIVCYARSIADFRIGRLPRTEEANARYSNPDNDPRGAWMSSDISVKTYNPANDYPITTPSGRIVEPPASRCWRLSPNAFADRLRDNRIWFGPDGNGVPRLKRFLSELRHEGIVPTSILYYKDVGHSQEGAQELVKLMDGGYFDGPKPVRLMLRLMTLANLEPDSIILDFFSGSATTAHAVMSLNAQDSGRRKFIMVQLPELCPEGSAFPTIAHIGRERIRRAGSNLTGDTGFRAFRVDTTNMADVSRPIHEYSQATINDFAENIKPGRSDLDLLFGHLLERGLSLSLPYSCEDIRGFSVHTYGGDEVVACFSSEVPAEVFREIAGRKPKRALFRDKCFTDDAAKINARETFRTYSPATKFEVL